jgi:hypothetical protein
MDNIFRRYILCPLIYGINYSASSIYIIANNMMYTLFHYRSPSEKRMIELKAYMKQELKKERNKELLLKEELQAEEIVLQEKINILTQTVNKLENVEEIQEDLKKLAFYTKSRTHNPTQFNQIYNHLHEYIIQTRDNTIIEVDKDLEKILRIYFSIMNKFSRRN